MLSMSFVPECVCVCVYGLRLANASNFMAKSCLLVYDLAIFVNMGGGGGARIICEVEYSLRR